MISMEIDDIAIINKAKIDIKRINVVGGVNSSGKTTASRILYCYLKAPDNPEKLLENELLHYVDPNNIKFSSDEKFSDIFYLESISILDLKDSNILALDHIRHIKECLETEGKGFSSDIISKIQEITGDECYSSAGIKQIGVIQILLENGTLKENSFLFIDEPESNLHPDWQIKFAEILVLLAKEMDITLYLNSYSPIFIEAISLYAQYHELIDDVNFYLTKENDNGRFDFIKINPKNMGDVYENLTRPYDDLDRLKAKILFKE